MDTLVLMNIPHKCSSWYPNWLVVSNMQPLLCIPPRVVGPFWMTLEKREKENGSYQDGTWNQKTEPRPSLHHLGKLYKGSASTDVCIWLKSKERKESIHWVRKVMSELRSADILSYKEAIKKSKDTHLQRETKWVTQMQATKWWLYLHWIANEADSRPPFYVWLQLGLLWS